MSRTPRVLGAVLVLVALASGSAVGARPEESAPDDPRLAPAAAAPAPAAKSPSVSSTTAVPSTTTSTSAPPSTVVLSRLPVPEPLPDDPHADDPDEPIGRIAIPAIGLDWELGEGMTLTEIDRGPAHWPGTALPGELGNVVVAGHRTTWGAPFRHLDALEPGDEIVFTTGDRNSVYVVTETLVVEPTELWIAEQQHAHIATLFACHPVGSAARRIVVRAALDGEAIGIHAT